MKVFFGFFLLALSLQSSAGVIEPVSTKISSTADKYYPLDKGSLVLEFPESGSATMEFESLLKSKGEDLRKIKTTELKVFGFGVGSNFQTIDFETGKVGKFTLPNEVYIWMQKNAFYHESEAATARYYRSFRVMLSLDIEEVKRLIGKRSNENGGDDVNGLAFFGDGVRFKPGKITSPLKPVPLTDPDAKSLEETYKKTHPKFKLTTVAKGSIGHRTFYRINGNFGSTEAWQPTGTDLLLKISDRRYHSFKQSLQDPDYATFSGDFISGDFIEGADGVLLREGDRMHDCHRMLIFFQDKIEEVALRCDAGGC